MFAISLACSGLVGAGVATATSQFPFKPEIYILLGIIPFAGPGVANAYWHGIDPNTAEFYGWAVGLITAAEAVGLAMAITGLALKDSVKRAREEYTERPRSPRTRRVQAIVAPLSLAGGGGLALTGRF